MTYVIVGSCIKDDSCIEVCPVDCIHPRIGAPDFEAVEQLYIDPAECIDCDACVEACPVDAIFAASEVPAKHAHAPDLNRLFFAELSTVARTAR
jgi:ferredoxin